WGAAPAAVISIAGLGTLPGAPPVVSGPFGAFPLDVFRGGVDGNLVGTSLVTQGTGARLRSAGNPGSITIVGWIYGLG
ncbi:hypothetical protein, partial [Microbacterium sp. GbtcB4]|uniref:hypothetical protein n=1 Tax=Microbacterium sp. GbtcB4 TaxID=2824749 RepID=UPI001C303084